MSESPNKREIMTQATGSKQRDAIVAYYDQTWLDYRLLWLNRRTLSVHFGYTDTTTRGHTDALQQMNRGGMTVVVVEQNATLALRAAKHAYVLETGRVVLGGVAADLQANESVRRSYLGY